MHFLLRWEHIYTNGQEQKAEMHHLQSQSQLLSLIGAPVLGGGCFRNDSSMCLGDGSGALVVDVTLFATS
jgi:hypothetical protein